MHLTSGQCDSEDVPVLVLSVRLSHLLLLFAVMEDHLERRIALVAAAKVHVYHFVVVQEILLPCPVFVHHLPVEVVHTIPTLLIRPPAF